ncbi:MAG: ATP-dependent helicase HrpB [Desulfobacterales bacterium]|nr:ATP-dependent helicase HrpB [Desulfobacterales bacterium]
MLPIEPLLPDIKEAIAIAGRAVLQAPPGAGKTTLVPLALLEEPWLENKKIILLEPRRLAARAAANRMAELRNQQVGETVGYRTRLDSRVGARTRIEVITEGILTRMLQDDPALEETGLVIFDEFHERSLQADLGLALCLETRSILRPDLRLLIMSATISTEPIAELLGQAPVITSQGRSFPVTTHYLGAEPRLHPEQLTITTVLRALAKEEGSILVFLPGVGEIRRVAALLQEAGLPANVHLAPLYGNLTRPEQDRAIRPCPLASRKIVLATSIAETSLTIDGIRVVIDSGLMRVSRFDPNSGMSRLVTLPVSRAAADQRRGRAGRLGPGVCFRLWTRSTQIQLREQTGPEILTADLAPLALELARWGVGDPKSLAWLDPVPAGPFNQARELLTELGALDGQGRLTGQGRRMAQLAMHPRLARMVLAGKKQGLGSLACDLAALISERDIIQGNNDPDIRTRLEILADQRHPAAHDRGAKKRIIRTAARWRKQLQIARENSDPDRAGLLLSLAFPDRIGQKRPGRTGRFLLANGRGGIVPAASFLARADYLVAAALDGGKKEARIFLGAPVTRAELEEQWRDAISWRQIVAWDSRSRSVLARKQKKLGHLVLWDEPLAGNDDPGVINALISGIREMGLEVLPWTGELRSWQARVLLMRRLAPRAGWPDVSDNGLQATLGEWLAPYITGMRGCAHLARLDLKSALTSLLNRPQQKNLEKLAPTHLTVPSGSRIRLQYRPDETPVLAVRLQEMFGASDTPRIGGGQVQVLLHLLSPAGRPVQVTRDLAGFWKNTYPQVRKDLRARYARHYWPGDPLNAAPTSRAKPRKKR